MRPSADMNRSGRRYLNASEVAAPERAEFIRNAVAKAGVPLDLQHRQGNDQVIDMRLEVVDLGPLSVQSIHMSAIAARRTPLLARDDSPPSLFVVARRTGFSVVVQNGQEAVIGPGDLVLVRSTQPSLILSDQPNHQQSLQIPLERLALPEPVLRQALALRLGPEFPLAGVLGDFVDGLTTVSGAQSGEAEHLARVAVDLVRGLVTTVQGAPRPSHEAVDALDAHSTLRLAAYLYEHWPDHGHTADRLTSAHHISTMQLHRLRDARGITLND